MKTPHSLPAVLAALVTLIVFGQVRLAAQIMKADYQFQGALTSSVGFAPAMTNLTGDGGPNFFIADVVDGHSRQSLRFPFNSGVRVATGGLVPFNNFTLVMLFRMAQLSGYRRVIDFNNGAQQCGGYIFNSRFELESTASNSILMPDTYVQAVFVREPTGRVRVYRDGVLKIDEPQDQGCFAINSNAIRFFQDDAQFPNEASPGSVARIRLYEGAMTTAQVQSLDRVPEPAGSAALPVLFYSARDGNFELYSMNSDGSNQRRLTNNPAADQFADYSPDRQKLAFASDREGVFKIYLMNADGTGTQRLTNAPLADSRPQWSPDGTQILFSRCPTTSTCRIMAINADGSGERTVVSTSTDNDRGAWSPDGSKIVFETNRDNPNAYEIYVVNIDGTNPVRLTVNSSQDVEPSFSPDGQKIVFSSSRDGQYEIYSMNANGTSPTRLTNEPLQDSGPRWSPDGTKIMFASFRATSGAFGEIFTMNADGSSPARATFNNQIDSVNDWVQFEPGTLTGQVTTPAGQSLRNAVVSLINASGVRRTATTSSFGLFSFDNVALGGPYTLTVQSKRYRFAPRTTFVSGNLANVNLVGLE